MIPLVTGGSTITRVPTAARLIEAGRHAASVSSDGTSCSKRRRASTACAAGTTRTRTDSASAPSPAPTAWTRASSGAASLARCSKSSVVTARPRERSVMGPRTFAFSMSSPSTPPCHRPAVLDAAHVRDGRLQDADRPRGDVPEPAAAGEVDVDLDPAPFRGTAPWLRTDPSGPRTAGPNEISPATVSSTK